MIISQVTSISLVTTVMQGHWKIITDILISDIV